MSRLECLGKSSTGLQKQLAVEVTSAHADAHKPSDKVGKKRDTDKPRRLPPARALPASLQISCQQTQRSGFPRGDVLNTDECSPKEPIIHSSTPRVEEQGQSTAALDEELKMKELRKSQPPDTTVTGMALAPPAVEPLPTHEVNGEEEQTEEEDVEDEDIRAPVELIMEFLRAVMDRDFQLASKLCQMILIYEPGNPEASEFLPLIQKKLLEEQEAEQSTEEDDPEDEEDEEDEEDDDDSESDEESSQSSSFSSSSPTDDDEEEKQVNRHKPCPPSHICP
ncbi:glutamate-rich protein 2 isoform X3 [Micropterus dolomieu]|uniref:glutamate-rich protein 2 isoform X3 n=1 Tax=Micropterus dolomieu TaxID=147949 RepID=UPI001E8EED87|nr:glutamate-rich protein 2 isoform X3 [Micropterus dolomieu]